MGREFRFLDEGEVGLREEIGTSEISDLLSDDTLTLLLKALREEVKETWRQAVTVVPSVRQTETYAGLTEAPLPEEVDEGEEFSMNWDFRAEGPTLKNKKYGKIIPITVEAFEDDRTGALKDLAFSMAENVTLHKNKTIFGLINTGSNDTCYDAADVIDVSGGHPPVTGGAAATVNINGYSLGNLTEANLEALLASMAGWQRRDGEKGEYTVKAIYVHPNQLPAALRLMGSPVQVGTNAGHALNIHATDNYAIISSPYFDAGRWGFLTTVKGYVYQQRTPLTVLQLVRGTGMNFLRDIEAVRVRERWRAGFMDWRSVMQGN